VEGVTMAGAAAMAAVVVETSKGECNVTGSSEIHRALTESLVTMVERFGRKRSSYVALHGVDIA
jgi:hypothetical protein